MSKKAVAIVGGIAGLVGLGWLIGRAVAKPTVKVALQSHPIRTVLLVDDKFEVATPKTITLTKGKHKFSVVSKSPDLLLTYGFLKWIVNGYTVSRNLKLEINVTCPSAITAVFRVTEAGIYPVITA